MSEALLEPGDIGWYTLILQQKQRKKWRGDRHYVLAHGAWADIVDWCWRNFPVDSWSWGNHENLLEHVPLYFRCERDAVWAASVWT